MDKSQSGGSGAAEQESKQDDFENILKKDILTAVTPSDGSNRELCKTFIFQDQDHTLGNILAHTIQYYDEVEFCAYTVPHPGENEMHLRIQTFPGSEPAHMLARGLNDVIEMCGAIEGKFNEAVKEYESSSSSR